MTTKRRVLLIDDDPDTLRIVTGKLERSGRFAVATAATGEEGIAAARKSRPDLIVADNGLPDMNGRELLGRLKTDAMLANLPIVFLTGSAEDPEIQALVDVGATAVLSKDSMLGDLAAMIERFLPAEAAAPPEDIEKSWWIFGTRGKEGPFSAEEMQKKRLAAELTGDEFSWKEGLSDWRRLDDMAELKPIDEGPPLVLVIDDEAEARLYITAEVERMGFRAVEADSAEAALRLARARRPALITLDLNMPGRSGREFFRLFQADPRIREIPLIVASIASEKHRGTMLGVSGFLQKPFAKSELESILRTHLARASGPILVVDDDPDIRSILVGRLGDLGFAAEAVENGQAAVEFMNKSRPGLILLDLQMPVMDGFTFLEKMREDRALDGIPVIIQSSRSLSGEEIEILSRRASMIFSKDKLFSEAFTAALKEALNRGRVNAAPAAAAAAEPATSDDLSEEEREEYRLSLRERHESLVSLRQKLEAAPMVEKDLRRLAHMIRGSAAMSGYPELSALARATEEAPESILAISCDRLVETMARIIANDTEPETRILVIDDDPIIARRIVTHMAGAGRTFRIATTGADAMTLMAAEKFSLVILDVLLPDMDGRSLLLWLREHTEIGKIPVIAISAAGGSTEAECYALGAEAFFQKPFSIQALEAALEAKIKQAGAIDHRTNRDSLTGLFNRAAFREQFSRESARIRRTKRPLAIAMLDIDHFKGVNDTHGHHTGDEVLKRLAKVLADHVRETDIVARWGGEEFILLFPETDAAGAAVSLRKILDVMRAVIFTTPAGAQFSITFSAGVALVAAEAPPDESIIAADRLLYRAKEGGRNRVVTAIDLADSAVTTASNRVLVVEDDKLTRGVIAHRLTREGFEVVTTSDGAEGCELALREHFKLLILDVQLPGMDGFEVLHRIRADSSRLRLPIIMLTSLGDEESVSRGLEDGANDYIVKPFSPTELIARVWKALKAAPAASSR